MEEHNSKYLKKYAIITKRTATTDNIFMIHLNKLLGNPIKHFFAVYMVFLKDKSISHRYTRKTAINTPLSFCVVHAPLIE